VQVAMPILGMAEQPPQTDVSRPSALPTANLRRSAAAQSFVDQNSAEYLDSIEEEWNKKVDVEIEMLVDGMVDIVNLASVSSSTARSLGSLWAYCWRDWGQGQVPRRAGGVPGSVARRVNGASLLLLIHIRG
jgi:hypothetical protein